MIPPYISVNASPLWRNYTGFKNENSKITKILPNSLLMKVSCLPK